VHLHNHEGDHLGTLDGFVVDSGSGRPIYYVIDSRGWFAGRRYVVPVGQIEADEGGTLRTALTRAELARYPEFSPSAFTAMDDRDALRYERRLHRVFAPDSKPYDGRPVYENLPAYRTPTWLKTGVWMSDASGFAVTRPNTDSDLALVRPVEPPSSATGTYERTAAIEPSAEPRTANPEPRSPNREPRTAERIPGPESELMIARGDSEEGDRDTESGTPRIERYRER